MKIEENQKELDAMAEFQAFDILPYAASVSDFFWYLLQQLQQQD